MQNKIYECVVGSQAYGTNLPTSDLDIKGVYCQPLDEILGTKYKEQINVDKDTTFYEVKRFLELLQTANPTVLEMLFVDDKFINYIHPSFQIVRDQRHKFLTKKCANSFGGYAVQQIKKAKGLNKKMNWEKERVERKTVLDFCYVFYDGQTVKFQNWFGLFRGSNLTHQNVGLTKLNNMPDCYGIYIDRDFKYGICDENSNDVRLSSIPKDASCQGIMHFNKDAYSIHCKEYREYQEWLNNRNTDRYVDAQTHGQQLDGKNILHCVRLLDCALEIAETGNLTVYRPNAAELLKNRKGECNLEQIIEECEVKIAKMDDLFQGSNLPNSVDPNFIHELLVEVRHEYYNSLYL